MATSLQVGNTCNNLKVVLSPVFPLELLFELFAIDVLVPLLFRHDKRPFSDCLTGRERRLCLQLYAF